MVRTLASICNEYVDCQIDFLKIDVEGWEEKVIVGNDWSKFRPTVIIIEATLPCSREKKITNISEFLHGKSYSHVYFDGLNDFYLDQESIELKRYFELPSNIFDNFTTLRVVELDNQIKDIKFNRENRDAEIINLKHQVSHYENQLFETKERIAAMESSKFWKIRKQWFHLKHIFGRLKTFG